MNNVPKMISSKDLDYISDMLNWNYYAAKECFHFAEEVQDEEIRNTLSDTGNMHIEHYKYLLSILK